MITLRATVPGPWGPSGSEFHVKEIGNYQFHVNNGTLVEVDAGMSSKERAAARAGALGLATSGTEKAIIKRIEEFEAVPTTADEAQIAAMEAQPGYHGGDSQPGT